MNYTDNLSYRTCLLFTLYYNQENSLKVIIETSMKIFKELACCAIEIFRK